MIDPFEIEMETERLAIMAAMQIERARVAAGLKKSEIADRLGVPRSRVTKVLDGQANMTLKTLAQFGLACGERWTIEPLYGERALILSTGDIVNLAECPSAVTELASDLELTPAKTASTNTVGAVSAPCRIAQTVVSRN